ncbi:MAG: HAMP domain-containing protein [Lachnospiraceae bacterium]|nr:HAMP domain-containing protein [Lachnospiraceae bacterium]
MKKIFNKSVTVFMIVALIISLSAVFVLQTVLTKNRNKTQSKDKLEQVKEKLKSNDEEIERLTTNLGENNLAKSRAFADILAANPEILENDDNLDEICDRLMVNELHIIDENGIITNSTVDAYIGFDMGSGEQSAAFLVIIDNPSIEIVQEPQKNAAEGIVVQYIGVARKDAVGVVQVGIRPEILEETLEQTAIDVVLEDIDFGNKGYIFAVDKATGEVLAHPNDELIGKNASEIGLSKNVSAGSGKAKIDGTKGYYYIEEYDDMFVGTFLPSSEYYKERTSQMIVLSITLIIIFVLLVVVIGSLVDNQIISGIQRINDSMKQIAGGDFAVAVDEKGSPEFAELSDSINTMTSSIRSTISHNETLIARQEQDMQSNITLIDNIKAAARNLDGVSNDTMRGADSIEQGTSRQKAAILELEKYLEDLEGELKSSEQKTVNVTDTSEEAVNVINKTRDKLAELTQSIDEISNISLQIEQIIDNINSIANQTNLLSLNASIEAARAGEAGRGFTVVASQVGELAALSSKAAQETSDLIQSTVAAVKKGKAIAGSTAEEFENVVGIIKQVDEGVDEIAVMVRENVVTLSETINEIEKIEAVVDENVSIAQNSKQISENMADVTGRLMELVN